jgi:hypothetical protein
MQTKKKVRQPTKKTLRARVEIMARYATCENTKKLAEELGISLSRLHVLAHHLQVKRSKQQIVEPEEENENLLYLEATEPEPTDFPSGSPQKIKEMAERIRNREELFHKDDRKAYS